MCNSNTRSLFTVFVADNFHYLDESENYEYGSFESLDAAIDAAKRIVNAFLFSALKPGMTSEQLYEHYLAFGDDPYISGAAEDEVPFSARAYARDQCAELCSSPLDSSKLR
jgi:hypothetical protein